MGKGTPRDAGADNENVVVWTGHARTGQEEKWKRQVNPCRINLNISHGP